MQIKYIVHTLSSKLDTYGNSYHAATVTNCANGKSATALIDAQSNARLAVWNVLCKLESTYSTTESTLPIREFNRVTKGLPYAYGSFEEIAKFYQKATE